MTHMLEKAIAKAVQLPTEQQDSLAAIILEEIEAETRWDSAFGSSPELLAQLATEAEEEDRKGLTEVLDPEAF